MSELIGERNEKGFFEHLDKVANEIKTRDNIVVIHHYDADGLTSGAIAIKALEREGKKIEHLCLKQVYKENVAQIKEMGENFLFVDFGSGQLEYLIDDLGEEHLFILDHHQPSKINGVIPKLKWHVNPLLYGIDGGKEISGAGVTFFFAKALNEKNKDLVNLALIGAVGDMQDFSGKLIGLNRELLKIGEEEKIISVKTDLRLYGRISRPLTSFLMFSSSPILPGLTADKDACLTFLRHAQIPLKDPFTDEWLSYEDLNEEKKQALSSALIMHLVMRDVPEWKIQSLVGEIYTLENETPKSPLRDAKEAGTLGNSCGRHAKPEVALNVYLGDRNVNSFYGQALDLIDEHRRELRKGIEYVQTNGVQEKKSFYFFDAKNVIQDSLVGIIAGMLYGSVIGENKPIIALARNEDESIKISGRGTSALIRRGLNLGLAFKEIGKKIEGVEGGGHAVAAGCKVPSEKIDEFLKLLDVELANQLSIKE
ncbi:MAG: DHH family phosphoesterase [archaeon]|jgi:RecJ-like exonuclease